MEIVKVVLEAKMENYKKYVPGLIVVFLIAVLSKSIDGYLSTWIKLEALTIGIILGMLYANTIGVQDSLKPGIQYSLKKLLKVGIVLLGFKLNFHALIELGPKMSMVVILFVPIVLMFASFLGKKMGIGSKLAILIGVGSSICGASAIVAMAPTINADDDEAIIAVGVVSLLGAVGVLAYSAIAAVSTMTDIQYGIWAGLSLQGVAHALAAAFARGDVAGEMGTFIKMERVLMLVPMSVILGSIFSKGNSSGSKRASFPMYVLYFVIAGVVASTGLIPESILKLLGKASGYLILMSMIAMGLMVNFASLRSKGAKALVMGSGLFAGIAVVSFAIASGLF